MLLHADQGQQARADFALGAACDLHPGRRDALDQGDHAVANPAVNPYTLRPFYGGAPPPTPGAPPEPPLGGPPARRAAPAGPGASRRAPRRPPHPPPRPPPPPAQTA